MVRIVVELQTMMSGPTEVKVRRQGDVNLCAGFGTCRIEAQTNILTILY